MSAPTDAKLHAAALDARMAVERIVQWSRTVKDPLLHTTSNKLAIEALGAVDGLLDMMEAS